MAGSAGSSLHLPLSPSVDPLKAKPSRAPTNQLASVFSRHSRCLLPLLAFRPTQAINWKPTLLLASAQYSVPSGTEQKAQGLPRITSAAPPLTTTHTTTLGPHLKTPGAQDPGRPCRRLHLLLRACCSLLLSLICIPRIPLPLLLEFPDSYLLLAINNHQHHTQLHHTHHHLRHTHQSKFEERRENFLLQHTRLKFFSNINQRKSKDL